ncbi:hypothetical protein [Cyclobacterium roseum]|uniref:hypothetical protein n=1 Tax=Cyclobacterium roseum TaxID=2666137 RepID=UPI001F3C951D|nr:hypothetical protein [Cyclobacterium roseum]
MNEKLPIKRGTKNFLFAVQFLALLAFCLPGTSQANEIPENVRDLTIQGTILDENG